MHSKAMAAMTTMAKGSKAKKGGAKAASGRARPLHDIVQSSIEVGVVIPSVLRASLEKAGYQVKAEKKKHGVQVEIGQALGTLLEQKHPVALEFAECAGRDPQAPKPEPATRLVVARAYSHDEADAILQAVYAEMREESLAEWDEGTVIESPSKKTK